MTEYPTKHFYSPQHAITAGFVAAMITKAAEEQFGGHAAMVLDGSEHTAFVDVYLPEMIQAFGAPAIVRIQILSEEITPETVYPPADWVA